MFARFVALCAIAFLGTHAYAAGKPEAVFTSVYARPSPGKIGIAYFTVTTATDDAITGVTSNCCEAVELHRTEKLGGVMKMRRIPSLSLRKNTSTEVQPGAKGGEHLMLIGLTKPLAAGDEVNVTFSFKKAPSKTIAFPVMDDTQAEGEHHHH